MRWKLTCRDAGDGSGDMILELPDWLRSKLSEPRAFGVQACASLPRASTTH